MASLMEKLRAGAEVVGKTGKAMVKKAIFSDDSPTPLSEETETILGRNDGKSMAAHKSGMKKNKKVTYPQG